MLLLLVLPVMAMAMSDPYHIQETYPPKNPHRRSYEPPKNTYKPEPHRNSYAPRTYYQPYVPRISYHIPQVPVYQPPKNTYSRPAYKPAKECLEVKQKIYNERQWRD